ncbi:hypothetical protein DV711_03855 [Motiliproteus coralliicola]|uniref:Uncharacterized protein n=1 Tax=Motiliproteus coralliicola TaxID=2283196 RepID=A0A369WUI5_9GAMM|nr:hypothetical protein DV711_03855 [Motiliproteus coralliicola]
MVDVFRWIKASMITATPVFEGVGGMELGLRPWVTQDRPLQELSIAMVRTDCGLTGVWLAAIIASFIL